MLNVFAPVFGEFSGTGFLVDGTECIAKFSAQEMIHGCCLGFRMQLIKKDNHDAVVNAFLLFSYNNKSGEIEMSLHDPKESFKELKRELKHQDQGSHRYVFSSHRAGAGYYRLCFDIVSPSILNISVELSSTDDGLPSSFHKVWGASLMRVASDSHFAYAA
jgi:hypothetical protein